MRYVKQADTWHVVPDEAKPEPAMLPPTEDGGAPRRDGRPSLRAKCGQHVHTGTFEKPIDENPELCKGCGL